MFSAEALLLVQSECEENDRGEQQQEQICSTGNDPVIRIVGGACGLVDTGKDR